MKISSKKKRFLFFSISALILVLGVLLTNKTPLYFKIHTWIWHYKNSNPFTWNNIQLNIPPDLVVLNKYPKMLHVASMGTSIHSSIFVKTDDITQFPRSSEKAIEFFENRGVFNYSRTDCEFSGIKCIKVNSIHKVDKENLDFESIVFPSKKMEISFEGKTEDKHYFDEIFSSLRFID